MVLHRQSPKGFAGDDYPMPPNTMPAPPTNMAMTVKTYLPRGYSISARSFYGELVLGLFQHEFLVHDPEEYDGHDSRAKRHHVHGHQIHPPANNIRVLEEQPDYGGKADDYGGGYPALHAEFLNKRLDGRLKQVDVEVKAAKNMATKNMMANIVRRPSPGIWRAT
jgi:hypothetical protein